MAKFYITTTAPYVNAEPHIGFALEIVQADALARYHRLIGDDVFFNTGTDEHGQKIYQKSLESKQSPQHYVDEYADRFDDLKQVLNLSYDSFWRSTNPEHIKAAQEMWRRVKDAGYIEKGTYSAKYCVGCELEKTDSDLVDGKCPLHPNRNIELIEEENYFFKFSKLADQLLSYYDKHPDFVVPANRLTEIKNFVKAGLQDFSISRIAEKMPWGIPVPNDSKHIMYVWFDALTYYISALGWPKDEKKFQEFWGTAEQPHAIQVAGKDNLRQQSAMWQAMLFAAGLPPTKQILIHGFITSNGQKMSKSLGNVVNPFDLVRTYGTDAVRYFLLAKVNPFEDSDFTIGRFENVYQSDLANGIGNLVQRVAKMCELYGVIKDGPSRKDRPFEASVGLSSSLNHYNFNLALESLWEEFKKLDVEINADKVWEEKQKITQRSNVTSYVSKLMDLVESLSIFLPETAKRIQEIFSQEHITAPSMSLFPRLKK